MPPGTYRVQPSGRWSYGDDRYVGAEGDKKKSNRGGLWWPRDDHGRRCNFGQLMIATSSGGWQGYYPGMTISTSTGTTVNFIMNDGQFVGVPWQMFCLDLFGWLSGLFTVFLIARRHRFLAAPLPRQRVLAAIIWFGHLMWGEN